MLNELPLETALTRTFGTEHAKIQNSQPLSGGCIHAIKKLTLLSSSGQKTNVVLKTNSKPEFKVALLAESKGLLALRAVLQVQNIRGLRVPKPYAVSQQDGYLLLEYLPPARSQTPAATRQIEINLGRALAELHHFTDWKTLSSTEIPELPTKIRHALSTLQKNHFGWYENNFPGTPHKQNYPPSQSWLTFFATKRILPLLQLTYKKGLLPLALRRQGDTLLEKLPQYLSEPRHASLVHGDLWSGNVMHLTDGNAALIDPAVYMAHREVDIALSELFGRRPPEFYNAYNESFPLSANYNERAPLYNLYHLLNHLKLFGSSYLPAVAATIRQYAR